MIKRFNEYFSNWNGNGYSYEEAALVATEVQNTMLSTHNIIKTNVKIEPIGNGLYKVHNTSSYKTGT